MKGFIEVTKKDGKRVTLSIQFLGVWEQPNGTAIVGSLTNNNAIKPIEKYDAVLQKIKEAQEE